MLIKIGCCGFPLTHLNYGAQFPVVEIQQTFYQPPRADTVRRWREELPPPFEFTLKAWQLITHDATSPTYRRLKTALTQGERHQAGGFKPTVVVRRAWEATREIALVLEARVILFQCPARFVPTGENMNRMRQFFGDLDRERFTLAWEPRGEWPRPVIEGLCRELDLVPAVDPFATPPFPEPLAYFRLHGIGGYRYKFTNADLETLKSLLPRYREAYVLFNNMSMADDARRFLSLVSEQWCSQT
jgi:uncharacterized protein YecE (DUF72 family)